MKLRSAAVLFPLMIGSIVTFAVPASAANYGAPAHQAVSNQSMMSLGHVLTLVEKAGYKNIWKIEFEHNYYEVKGFDAKGQKVKLKVNPTTGAIKQTKPLL